MNDIFAIADSFDHNVNKSTRSRVGKHLSSHRKTKQEQKQFYDEKKARLSLFLKQRSHLALSFRDELSWIGDDCQLCTRPLNNREGYCSCDITREEYDYLIDCELELLDKEKPTYYEPELLF